ncbi:MAG: ABC transporter ATPase [Saprospiraceae bacterium]
MEIANLLPQLARAESCHPQSRLWIYIADRPLTETESRFAQEALSVFTRQWTSHNHQLKAEAEWYQNRILILLVDESLAGASGCSIDKSVHFLESLGKELQIDFFDRMQFAWIDAAGVLQVSNRPEFQRLLQEGVITPETLVVNTLADTRAEIADNWLLPYKGSWVERVVG